MYSNSSSMYSLKHQARSLEALVGDTEQHKFLVGSMSVEEENEIHLIEFSEDRNDLACNVVYTYPHEIWNLSPCPTDPELVFASNHDGNGFGAELLRLPGAGGAAARGGDEGEEEDDDDDEDGAPPRRPAAGVAALPAGAAEGAVTSLAWAPAEGPGAGRAAVATLDERTLRLWDLGEEGGPREAGAWELSARRAGAARAAAWDPHRPEVILTVHGCDILVCDIRQKEPALRVAGAHRGGACSVDANPNRPYFAATAGMDRRVAFWDLRAADSAKQRGPARALTGHDHWVRTARYNRHHDQLLISGGDDGIVQLWRCSSVSSAPLLELDGPLEGAGGGEEGGGGGGADPGLDSSRLKSESADAKVKTFDEHEESVYAVAWSACDAWVFVSLSYDGQVLLNHVPSTEKYKILL